jgi:hypothetical protein
VNLVLKHIFGWKGAKDADLFKPRMPDVDVPTTIADIFENARQAARGQQLPATDPNNRYLVVVTPGRMLMHQPCPPAGSMPANQVASIEKLIPSSVKRGIAVIAYTEVQAVKTDINKAIPFAGLLLGFAYLGHAVWVFEGHESALAAGCRDADALVVDGGMVPYLAGGWANIAASVMRHREIYVHDRTSYQLSRISVK